jgi:hypothetical protein
MRLALRAPLPEEAITPHPTKTFLSSIKPIYVVERLNDVFGVGAFQLRSELVERADGGTVVTKTTLTIPEYDVYLEAYGGNNNGGENSKNFDLGDAFKGSVSDSLTKICSYLEIGLDVYKGKHKPQNGHSKGETSHPTAAQGDPGTKPWLNPSDEAWSKAVKALKDGKTMADVEAKFRISKDNKKKLVEESMPVNQN